MFERKAFVKLGGQFVYLGTFGTEVAEQKYRRAVAEWRARGCWVARRQVLVKHVIAGYWKHAEVYYRKGGQPTSELSVIRLAMRYLNDFYGSEAAEEFGPVKLNSTESEALAGLSGHRNAIGRPGCHVATQVVVTEHLVAGCG